MRISDWSSDVCSSDLLPDDEATRRAAMIRKARLQAQVAGALGAALMIAACNPSATDDAATAPATADRQALWANALREIGRASCRERVCQYVEISVVAVSLQNKKKT